MSNSVKNLVLLLEFHEGQTRLILNFSDFLSPPFAFRGLKKPSSNYS